jgi:peptidylprolyl isomerase
MKKAVRNGDTVVVEYAGKFDDGELFDTTKGKVPIEFEVGAGAVIKGFEEAVVGMKAGEEKRFVVKPEAGYGERRDEFVQEVPRMLFPKNMELKEGGMLKIKDPHNRIIFAKVLSVTDKKVKVDINHPLAGRNLNFEIKLLGIK